MKKLIVNGAEQLYGEVSAGGAKNAAVAIIPATVLARGRCVLENVPDIHDTELLFSMLRAMGATVEKLSRTSAIIDTSTLTESTVPYELSKHMRASYYFIGSLLGRFGQACVSMPGGCNFGVRPIDQHIKGFELLGAEIRIENGLIYADTEGLQGAHIYFDQVSVGATINVMLAAVKASGMPVLADDSGLMVDALDGAPGVYSARYAGEGHDSAANNAKLLREMEKIPDERRAARFVCAICAVFGEVDIVRCEGACEGTIARRLHGQNGFGYDPLFMVGERSFAELDGPAKDAISHRGRALAALYEKLKDRKEGE